jgi:hypothetical protein
MTDTSTGANQVGPTLVVKLLKDCSVGELVRLETGSWAIMANDPDQKDRSVFLIAGRDAPRTFLLKDSDWMCLSYGTGFHILPVHTSFVGIHTYGSKGFDSSGKLICSTGSFEQGASTRRFFAAPVDGSSHVRFLDLETYQAGGEPRGHRALFSNWEVSIDWPGHRELVTLVNSQVD